MGEMEQLVEEIDDILDMYLMIPGSSKGTRAYLPIAGAKHLITRIGRAYAEGLPFPGEVGRDIMARFVADAFDEGIAMEGSLRYDLKPGDTIIALRKEEERKER